jgi:hypothetical protein
MWVFEKGSDSRKRGKFGQAGEAQHITLSASGAVILGNGEQGGK